MGKLSAEDKATLDRLQQMQSAPDGDDDDYVWVRLENGNSVRLHGDRARSWCKRHGIDIDDAEDSTAGNPVDPKKAAPAKKAAAPKKAGAPAEPEGEGEGEELADDPPSQGRPRTFF